MEAASRQIDAVVAAISRMAPDILFLCEAPAGEGEMERFVRQRLTDFELVKRPAGQAYATRGDQWQWFLVRGEIVDRTAPELLDVTTWRDFAARASQSIRPDGTWMVSIPRLATIGDVVDVPVATRASHRYFRHPQTLRVRVDGELVEIIGVHFKSKFTAGAPRARRPGEPFEIYASEPQVARYLANSHAARVKLSSEALNVRAYIDHRFRQEDDPAILVIGDLNDGPGKELFEREYLLHDLISNLQGDIFFAMRFLNHALFDAPQHLRWTARFSDRLEPDRDPMILLDHILFTQALTRSGSGPLRALPKAGAVEHLVHEEVESVFGTGVASDHRPVSLRLAARTSV